MKKFWKRISDLDKLSYAMVIVFGISLLSIMLFFQFGYQLGEIKTGLEPFVKIQETELTKVLLIDEPNPIVRGIEILISLGLITLGINRFRNLKRKENENTT